MNSLPDILGKFKEKNLVVIGDVMLDCYLEGNVSRINPEAPVPIVILKKEFYELGGAANVAANISALGPKVELFGFCGNDSPAEILKSLLKEKNISYNLERDSCTIKKTRVIGNMQQLIRFDKESPEEKKFSSVTRDLLHEKLLKADLVVISDYAKGTITKNLMQDLERFKQKMIVDPKPCHKNLFQNVFLIAPNEKESFEMSMSDNVKIAGPRLRQEMNSNVLITRGEKGMSLFAEKNIEIPTQAHDIFDVTGAGDTVLAALASSIASGSSLEQAAIIANHAAGIAVEKKGTYAVSLKELKEKIMSEERKVLEFEELKKIIVDAKRKNRRIVWTNGCFDLLHVGHVHYLKEAKKLGDLLVVGINSDSSVKEVKGPSRPIQSEYERAEILSSLKYVDYLLIFSEPNVEKYLRELQPEIFVKGGDYSLDTIDQTEKKIVESYNGQIVFIPLVEGKSTSKIIETLYNNKK